MDVHALTDSKAVARNGLRAAEKHFTRSANIRAAENALQDVVHLDADRGSVRAARIGLAGSKAAAPSPRGRLRLLCETLRAIESGANGSAGFQASLASNLVDAFDGGKFSPPLRNPVICGLLGEMAQDKSLPQAGYFSYLAALAPLTEDPRGLLNYSTRASMPAIDVTTPSWYAVVATGVLHNAEFRDRHEEADSVLQSAELQIRALAQQRHDNAAAGHFARLDRYLQLPLSGPSQHRLHGETLGLIANEVPSAAESALILAYKVDVRGASGAGRPPRTDEQDMKLLLDTAIAEARHSSYPAGSSTPALLNFMQAGEAVPAAPTCGAWLQQNGLYALVHGKPASSDSLRRDAEYFVRSLRPLDQDKLIAATVLQALLRLDREGGGAAAAGQAGKVSLWLSDAVLHPEMKSYVLQRGYSEVVEALRGNPVGKRLVDEVAASPQDATLLRGALQSCVLLDAAGDMRQLAELGLRVADAAANPLAQTRALQMAFVRIEGDMRKDAVARPAAEAVDQSPEDAAVLRAALESCVRQDGDAMGRALYNTFEQQDAAPPKMVENGEEFVTIGNLKIPKRVVQQSTP